MVGYAYGFGITSIDADDIVYSFCEGEYAGYQNFGFFDRTTNSKMLDSFSGMGHRTSSQIHRSCDNIEVLRNRIIQTANPGSLEPHGAFTIHGRSGGEEASNILLEDNVIEMTGGYKSALQAFQASLNLTARRNTIKSNGEGIRLGSGKGALFENNTLISQKEAGLELEYGNIGINVIEGLMRFSKAIVIKVLTQIILLIQRQLYLQKKTLKVCQMTYIFANLSKYKRTNIRGKVSCKC